MNRDLIGERVLTTVSRELDLEVSEVGLDGSRASIEFWDSLGHLRICLAVEAEFGTRIPMDIVETLDSVHAIVEFLVSSID